MWIDYSLYQIADQPGQKDALREALHVIAKHRNSQLIESRLMAELKGKFHPPPF